MKKEKKLISISKKVYIKLLFEYGSPDAITLCMYYSFTNARNITQENIMEETIRQTLRWSKKRLKNARKILMEITK